MYVLVYEQDSEPKALGGDCAADVNMHTQSLTSFSLHRISAQLPLTMKYWEGGCDLQGNIDGDVVIVLGLKE